MKTFNKEGSNEKKTRDSIDIELSRTYFGHPPEKEEKKTRDNIDLELSRTYFGHPPEKKKVNEHRNTKAPSIIISRFKLLFIFGALVFFALYFINQRHLISNINIITRQEPPSRKSANPPEKPTSSDSRRSREVRNRTVRPGRTGARVKAPKKNSSAILTAVPQSTATPVIHALENEITLFDFEKNEEGWKIPPWEFDGTNCVARSLRKAKGIASKGNGSIELYAEFPEEKQTSALAEIQQYLNFDKYNAISADIYLPPHCPKGLKGKLILTVGENWQFVEMVRSTGLNPGCWTTITANTSKNSTDWKKTKVDRALLYWYRTSSTDVRKIAIRIESNKIPYSGPVYIDNVRVSSATTHR